MQVLECVPNFSEGRDAETLEAIAASIRNVRGVKLLDYSANVDHHRSVFTFMGEPAGVGEAALAAALVAVERIDLRRHHGEHPRIGAVDVVPFVPIRSLTMQEATGMAREFGHEFGRRAGVPVFFYGEAATSAERRSLPFIRRGQYESLSRRLQQPAWRVDAGPQTFNAKVGATAVGARRPLIAFNVNLETSNVEIARAIARGVRESGGGLPHLQAIGVSLRRSGLVQVAMNFTDYEKTPISRGVEAVKTEAHRYGVRVSGTELIGLIPQKALQDIVRYYLQLPDFSTERIIEANLLD
ncbi:MAG: glutamate formimidoyltransferase [Candidatus Tectomicrobia bacterium]|nr:glutamate formimidoyltransferase [Candidatus Tectomicrobia bacterium]